MSAFPIISVEGQVTEHVVDVTTVVVGDCARVQAIKKERRETRRMETMVVSGDDPVLSLGVEDRVFIHRILPTLRGKQVHYLKRGERSPTDVKGVQGKSQCTAPKNPIKGGRSHL
jgi:hypothetical protein